MNSVQLNTNFKAQHLQFAFAARETVEQKRTRFLNSVVELVFHKKGDLDSMRLSNTAKLTSNLEVTPQQKKVAALIVALVHLQYGDLGLNAAEKDAVVRSLEAMLSEASGVDIPATRDRFILDKEGDNSLKRFPMHP